MNKFHSPSPSKSVTAAPSCTPITASQILSNIQLSDWRGSITIFKGFTGTRPVQEFEDIPWNEVCKKVCPDNPLVTENKKDAVYFVSCLLKDAPLIGNTFEFAKKNGEPLTGKMRSKHHVTESAMLLIDIDGFSEADLNAGLANIKSDGITYLAYTTHSYGSPDKPGMRIRLIVPLDKPVNTEGYAAAWHGFDRFYWQGKASKADASGANLYQQQGSWCCHPSRVDQAQSWINEDGIASADFFIELGRCTQVNPPVQLGVNLNCKSYDVNEKKAYPLSDANKIANQCNQIRTFRDNKGAGQSEPLWFDCIGVVGYCENGEVTCQDWSSGHSGYNVTETAQKLAYRLKISPTTCTQFKKSNPSGCQGCMQKCSSPITLGWPDTFKHSKISSNAGVISATDEEVIVSLAGMKPMEYDRVRLEKAKELNIQVKTLDAQVKELRNEKTDAANLLFPEIEPFPNPINLALLLDEISEVICRFVIVENNQADTAALWIAHTYLIDIFDISPIAIINAPEKACAKTLFQTLLARMAYRPMPAANASVSALFRAVELWKPTILFDEADTFFRENKELQGLVNAGYKRGGFVLRSESTGESFEPRMFSVYSAKSIAGISLERHLPDSTMSRGIIFNMRRKLAHESVTRMRHAESQLFEIIVSKLTRFAIDYAQQVRLAQPKLPDELSDRDQDNWEALLAIAECAGPEWLHRATAAALALSSAKEGSVSTGNELLEDIQGIFESKHVEKISTADLIEALIAEDESAWATYNRGKPITPRQLAKMLAGYGIKSKTVRLGHANTPKGYDKGQFEDVFARYLSAKLPQQCNDSPEANTDKAVGVADNTQRFCKDYLPLGSLSGNCKGDADKSGNALDTADEF